MKLPDGITITHTGDTEFTSNYSLGLTDPYKEYLFRQISGISHEEYLNLKLDEFSERL